MSGGVAVAWGLREQVGIAAWLTTLSGYNVEQSQEDARAEVAQRWGLDKGVEYQRVVTTYRARLIERVRLTLTIVPGVAHVYMLALGNFPASGTPLYVVASPLTVDADLPGIVEAAWNASGLSLGANGTDGLTLIVVDNTTYEIAGSLAAGGVPNLVLGYGWTIVSTTETEDWYEVNVVEIEHAWTATAWMQQRARGLAQREATAIMRALHSEEHARTLLPFTGQRLCRANVVAIDRDALGAGGPTDTMDVSALELVVVGVDVHCTRIDTLQAVELNPEYLPPVIVLPEDP